MRTAPRCRGVQRDIADRRHHVEHRFQVRELHIGPCPEAIDDRTDCGDAALAVMTECFAIGGERDEPVVSIGPVGILEAVRPPFGVLHEIGKCDVGR